MYKMSADWYSGDPSITNPEELVELALRYGADASFTDKQKRIVKKWRQDHTDPFEANPEKLLSIAAQNDSHLTSKQHEIITKYKDTELETQENLSVKELVMFWANQKGENLENKINDILDKFEQRFKPTLGEKQLEDIRQYSEALNAKVLATMSPEDQKRLHYLHMRGITRLGPLQQAKSLIRNAAYSTAYNAANILLHPGRIVADTLQAKSIIAPVLFCTASVGSYVADQLMTNIFYGGLAFMGSHIVDSCNSTSPASGGKRLRTRTRRNKKKQRSARTRHRRVTHS